MKHRALLLALASALCLTSAAAADSHWTAVRSESMTVIGDQSADTLRGVALELEQFRAVLGRFSATGRPAATAPTLVYVFGSRNTFQQFVPLRNGRPLSFGGYFQANPDINTIALSTDGFEESAPVVFHEYSHLLIGTAVRAMPVWMNEGLAEYYSTYHLRPDGKGADVGRPIARHVALLRDRFVPLAELLAVDHASDLYNEGDRRSIFYAESWALTHYLMTELPSGPRLINQFAAAIAGGARPDEAFASTFGMTPSAFEPRLRVYVTRTTFKSWIFTFKEGPRSDAPPPARVLSHAEAEAWLGDLQLRIRRTAEAARRIEAAAAAEPDSAAVQLVLGRLRLSQGRGEDARLALERAARLAPETFEIQYGAGVASLQDASDVATEHRDALAQRAREALARAATLDPDSPDAFGWLAYAGLLQKDWNDASRAIARAVALAPGRLEFRLRQADIMILRGAPAAARPMLQEIAAHSVDRVSAEAARRRLDALDAAGVRTAPTTLVLRAVQDGEQRALGRLTAVECGGGQVRFHVDAGGRDLVTAASSFAVVDLVVYTEMKDATLGCGARTSPEPVYVTWRLDTAVGWPAGVAGVAVAIEFLPRDFVPD